MFGPVPGHNAQWVRSSKRSFYRTYGPDTTINRVPASIGGKHKKQLALVSKTQIGLRGRELVGTSFITHGMVPGPGCPVLCWHSTAGTEEVGIEEGQAGLRATGERNGLETLVPEGAHRSVIFH